MVKKICNHCGRIYVDICPCRKDIKRNNGYHDSFYDSTRWKKVAESVKRRDMYQDRLAMYLLKVKEPADDRINLSLWKKIRNYLIFSNGSSEVIRRLGGALVVHHIVPKTEDKLLCYAMDNLITLDWYSHEYIHQLYGHGNKDDVQLILREAIGYKF